MTSTLWQKVKKNYQDDRCSKVAAGDPAVTTSNLSLCPASGTGSGCARLTRRVQLSTALLLVLAVLQLAEGICLLQVGPQHWRAQSVAPTIHSPE